MWRLRTPWMKNTDEWIQLLNQALCSFSSPKPTIDNTRYEVALLKWAVGGQKSNYFTLLALQTTIQPSSLPPQEKNWKFRNALRTFLCYKLRFRSCLRSSGGSLRTISRNVRSSPQTNQDQDQGEPQTFILRSWWRGSFIWKSQVWFWRRFSDGRESPPFAPSCSSRPAETKHAVVCTP